MKAAFCDAGGKLLKAFAETGKDRVSKERAGISGQGPHSGLNQE